MREEELQSTIEEEREKSSMQTQQLREELRRVHDQHNHKVLQLDLQYKVHLSDLCDECMDWWCICVVAKVDRSSNQHSNSEREDQENNGGERF